MSALAATVKLELRVAAQATATLERELAIASTTLLAAQLRGSDPAALRRLAAQLLLQLTPGVGTTLDVGAAAGRLLGQNQAVVGEAGSVPQTIVDEALVHLLGTAGDRVRSRLAVAVQLSTKLPMTNDSDLIAVLAQARTALTGLRTDAAWGVHRSVALGHADVALQVGENLVWITERNACPHCLAYAGHVTAPGKPFPPGLTYGDKALTPYGPLLGPPLHPHCRCEVELTELEPGELDVNLAREAARSVARGLTDYQSEAGKQRAVDRLLQGKTGLPVVQLPKSVLERAARDLKTKQFKARPGSAQAQAEIAQRARDRARRGTSKV